MAPAPCNYLLKTPEDKRKNATKLVQEQPSLPGTGEQLRLTMGSAVPMSLALCSVPGWRPGEQVPWTGSVQGLSEEKPFHGCVQDKAARRGAVCLSNAALPWHLLSPLTSEPTPLKCYSGPDPTERARAGRGWWATRYSSRLGASNCIRRWLIQLALPILSPAPYNGPQPFPAFRSRFLYSFLAL